MTDLWVPLNPKPTKSQPASDNPWRSEYQVALLESRVMELQTMLNINRLEPLVAGSSEQFSKATINDIADLVRVMALKNPLFNRAISIKTAYTFGQGVTVSAKNSEVNAVIQEFLDDDRNQSELTSHSAIIAADRDLQCDGNRFFVLFTSQVTGRVRVRSIPLPEVVEIIKNPEDRKEAWYYLRAMPTGQFNGSANYLAYPDLNYCPKKQPAFIDTTGYGKVEVQWGSPVYHVKHGGFSDWDFGVSELYAGIDWARAYNRFLEDVATYMATISTFAVKATTGGGRAGIAAAQQKLASTIGSQGYETNPPPATGSVFIRSQNAAGVATADWEPVKVSGMTISPEDGRRFLLMFCAAAGLPETFFGDVSVGSRATAQSMDRPTELVMLNRQKFWHTTLMTILRYVVMQATVAPQGRLANIAVVSDGEGADPNEVVKLVAWKKRRFDTTITVSLPNVVDIDANSRISAITNAATLNGKASAGQVIDMRTTSRLILEALGVTDIDVILAALYPEKEGEVELIKTVGNISDTLALLTSGVIDTATVQKLLGIRDIAALQARINQEVAARNDAQQLNLAQAMLRAQSDFDRGGFNASQEPLPFPGENLTPADGAQQK